MQFKDWWYGGRRRFKGNQWVKPLAEDELRILWYILRFLSFQQDML